MRDLETGAVRSEYGAVFLYQRDSVTGRSAPATGYPSIPEADRFYHRYGYERPAWVYGWQRSCDFGRWGALVLFYDGWEGFTYPAPEIILPDV